MCFHSVLKLLHKKMDGMRDLLRIRAGKGDQFRCFEVYTLSQQTSKKRKKNACMPKKKGDETDGERFRTRD